LAFFESIPAEELMSDGEFKYYTRALTNLDCELAGILLNTAFTRHYPQFEWARLKRDCVGDEECSDWNTFSSSIFNEYGHCEIISNFTLADDEIRIHNLVSPKFNIRLNLGLNRKKHKNPWIDKRNWSITRLITHADGDYIPALLKVGELLRRGDVFVHSAEAEYYVLKRACFVGYEDCAGLELRLAELENTLSRERITRIEQRASINPFAPTFLTDLLIDGKL